MSEVHYSPEQHAENAFEAGAKFVPGSTVIVADNKTISF